MINCMTWKMEDPEPFLEVDVRLNVTLEVIFYCNSGFFFLFFHNFNLVQSSVALRVWYTVMHSDGCLYSCDSDAVVYISKL